jgi:hypothetical protein
MTPPNRPGTGPSFPTVGVAVMLTVGAIAAEIVVMSLFSELGLLAAQGLGTALGIGCIATLAARRVPDPQAQRLGFVPLEWRAWPIVLGLVPTIFLASELDNFAYDLSPQPPPVAVSESATTGPEEVDATDAAATTVPGPLAHATPAQVAKEPGAEVTEKSASSEMEAPEAPEVPHVDFDDPYAVMEGLIAEVGIAPVIHEFLFRGVLQQGLVTQLGVGRGVALTALLWTMLRPVPSLDPARFAAAFVAWLAMGWLLGMVRIGTGSILGSILLASLWSGIGFASSALASRHPILGMNVDGTHLPVPVTIASLAAVTWAVLRLMDRAQTRAGAQSS